MLNKQKGNMYGFVDKTRNYLAGECKHKCSYCYVQAMKNKFPNLKERYSGVIRLLDKELKKDEGTGKMIFVQDMGDLFAEDVLSNFIIQILNHLKDYPKNTYLFQTKNPKRYLDFKDDFPENSLLGTTIETNKQDILDKISKAPSIEKRKGWMERIKFCKTFVTLEPLLDFDLEDMIKIIKEINPEFVNIGADSKGHNLEEPPSDKIKKLIKELEKFTKVNIKENLKRILR